MAERIIGKPLLGGRKAALILSVSVAMMAIGAIGVVNPDFWKFDWPEFSWPDLRPAASQPVPEKMPEGLPAAEIARLKGLPADTASPARFRGQQSTVTLGLKSDRWSRQVILPLSETRSTRFRIDVDPPDGYWLFDGDSRILRVDPSDGPDKDLGILNGPLRFLGRKPGQTMTIKVEFLPRTLSQSP